MFSFYNHFSRARFLAAFLVMVLFSACNLPARRTPAPAGAGSIYTAAAQTVQAQLTRGSQPSSTPVGQSPGAPSNTPVFPSLPPPTALVFPSATSLPPSPVPPATPTPIPCDRVKFISDVTIPDNTEIDPGAVFVKTWRLQNAGSCTWNPAYTLVVEGENLLNAPPVQQFTPGTVPPGGIIDVSVTLTAPVVVGTYRQNFKLANASGQRFGLGDGTKPFWAQIKVFVPAGIGFDFLVKAPQASWQSGRGNISGTEYPDTPLVYGGAEDDANGVAKLKEGVKLETGFISGKVLLTFPKHENNGIISGTFPPYLVQAGDRLRARLGFLANLDGTCGSGQVRFQVGYVDGGTTKVLGEWPKSCDGKLLAIDIDLSSLIGKTIQIVFTVKANGAFADDWAIWNSPRIER